MFNSFRHRFDDDLKNFDEKIINIKKIKMSIKR